MKKILLLIIIIVIVSSFFSFNCMAKYPEKKIDLVVGFSTGGSSDIFARMVAAGLEKELGKQVMVINKPGAGGEIGYAFVANATPDGYTIMVSNTPNMSNLILTRPDAITYSMDDFVPIANIVTDPQVLLVNSESSFQNLEDLINAAKEKPGTITIGTDGVGTPGDMLSRYFNKLMEVNTVLIPFEGGSEMRAALLGRHVAACSMKISEADQEIEEGKIRCLGIMTDGRFQLFPDILTFKEQGVDMVAASSRGIVAPEGTPDDIIEFLAEALKNMVNTQAFQKRAEENKMPINYMSVSEYKEFYKFEDEFSRKLFEAIKE